MNHRSLFRNPRQAPRCRALAFVALVVSGVGAVSCGDIPTPEAYSPPTSQAESAGEQENIDLDEPATAATTPVYDRFVPTPDLDYEATLIVSGDRSTFGSEGEDSFQAQSESLSGTAIRAVDDFGGGLLTQDADGRIIHHQASGQVEELAAGAELLDVGYWNGSPRVFIKSAPNRIEWIQLAVESPGAERERRIHIELEPGEEIIDFSAGGYLQAVIVNDGECGRLEFFDPQGPRTDLSAPTAPACTFRGRPVFSSVAIGPLSDSVAVAAVTYRDDGIEAATDLLVAPLGESDISGDLLVSPRRIGEGFDAISSLTFDGTRVAYIRASSRTPPDPLVVTVMDLVGGAETQVDLLGQDEAIRSVAFARLAVDALS